MHFQQQAANAPMHFCVNIVCIYCIYTLLYSRITLNFVYDLICLHLNVGYLAFKQYFLQDA